MKTYELVIEQRQPTCGHQSPTKAEIKTVTVEDPVAYVRTLEPVGEFEVYTDEDGAQVVQLDRNGLWVKYIFTEE